MVGDILIFAIFIVVFIVFGRWIMSDKNGGNPDDI